MAKFETRVAGVTFYDVDFSIINSRSKVTLVPNPKNRHDANAIKVIIDGRHVGHIPRSLNTTLLEYIRRSCDVTARVIRVTGTENHRSKGILLAVVVASTVTRPTQQHSSSLGAITLPPQEDISVIRSPANLPDTSQHKAGWIGFLEKEKGLPQRKEFPLEPDYQALYRREVPFLRRILKDSRPFIQNKRNEWLHECSQINTHNKKRNELIKHFLEQHLDAEFALYERKARIAWLLNELGIMLTPEPAVGKKRQQGYVTVYEEYIYHALKNKYTLFRQAVINNYSVDFLVILTNPYRCWAIEIDGGIHRRKSIADRDRIKESSLTHTGIHLIRVSNRFISRNHTQATERILQVLQSA